MNLNAMKDFSDYKPQPASDILDVPGLPDIEHYECLDICPSCYQPSPYHGPDCEDDETIGGELDD